MAFPTGTLAVDSIVVGRSWEASIVLDPAPGKVAADVVTELTGATCTARIVDTDGSTVITSDIAESIDAASRTITLTLTAAQTASLVPGRYRWDVKITATDTSQWPVRMPGIAQVRALP